uniref:Uncharacterized protein n=1 Tax=Vombatus ursinus TaxID=29139 RepID=A0A4X2LVC8_VOMUR
MVIHSLFEHSQWIWRIRARREDYVCQLSSRYMDRFLFINLTCLNNKKTIIEGRWILMVHPVENHVTTMIQDVYIAVVLTVMCILRKNKMNTKEWNHDLQYRQFLKQGDGTLGLLQLLSYSVNQ